LVRRGAPGSREDSASCDKKKAHMVRSALVLSLVLCAQIVPAHAVTVPVVAVEAYHYLPGDTRDGTALTITQGEHLQFVNLDAVGSFHTLTAADSVDGVPLFDSGELTPPGAHSEVIGTAKLLPGSYLFYCSSHGAAAMSGRLDVVAS